MRFCSLLVEVREPKWWEGMCLPLVPVAVRQGLPSSGLVPKSAPSLSAFYCHWSVAPPSPLHTHTQSSLSPLLAPHCQALGRRSKALTALLKQRYSASLARDEVFAAYLMQARSAAYVSGGGCLCQQGRCFTTLYRQSVTNLWAAVYNQ